MAAVPARPLPLEAAAKAKQHMLDTFAAMISGSELPPGRAALAFARAQAGGRPAATVAGSTLLASADRRRARQRRARALRRDRRLARRRRSRIPGASIVPAALALGEELGIDGSAFPARRRARLRRRHAAHDGARRRRSSATRAAAARTRSPARSAPRRRRAAARGLDAQQMRWLLDYASQQASGYRGLGPRHRSHREGVRVRRHAGAQRRHRGAARPGRLDRRRRRVLGRRTTSSRSTRPTATRRCSSRSSASGTRSSAPTSRSGRSARRSRRRSTRSRTCARKRPFDADDVRASSCGWRRRSAPSSTTATSRTSACSTWSR